MARFIPPVPDDFNGSFGEEEAFKALRVLDNKYTVFHSFNWISIGERTQGEADFVVIHPNMGVMVIEVKSGEIEYKDGQWFQTNTVTRYEKKIAPFDQACRSKYEILERLNKRLPLGSVPLVCHAVWFPSITIVPTAPLPPEAPIDIVLDKTALSNAAEALERAFGFWENKARRQTRLNTGQLNEVVETISPHFHVVPGMRKYVEEAEQVYIRLTDQQAALLDYLSEQPTAAIHGLAGTGKTVLAREKAKMLTADGETVLYLCFNSFLKDFLRKQYPHPGVTYHNAHSLAAEFLKDNPVDVDVLLQEFEDYLVAVFEPQDWTYSHVVIDEGQDLSDRLVQRLFELTRAKGGNFYVFYDRNQFVMHSRMPTWVEQADCRLVLHRNCRNTAEISKAACSMIRHETSTRNMFVHGETPEAILIKSQSEMLGAVHAFVNKAISFGIEPHDIAILTVETETKSTLSEIRDIGGLDVSRVPTTNCVLFSTVRKFKGLEAKAVMVVDISLKGLLSPEKQKLAYVGCSRARHLLGLAILEDADPSGIVDYLADKGRNVPKSRKGLARLLNVKMGS